MGGSDGVLTVKHSKALTCLAGLRAARSGFFVRLANHAQDHAPEERREADGTLMREYLALLRNEGAAQIAELFFLIRELGLNDASKFRGYLESHNAAMNGYLDDPSSARMLGLSQQRIKSARFPEDRIKFLEFISPPGKLLLDQASVGRLLTEAMAPETCRKIVIALAEGGLLMRHEMGHVMVSSVGVLEDAYRDHLMEVVTAVEGGQG